MGYIIGIDGGGTKTLGYIGDTDGNILGVFSSGAANYFSIGIDRVKANLEHVIQSLCKKVQIDKKDLTLISLGLAGVDREQDRKIIMKIISQIGINCKIILNNDAKTALVGAHGQEKGIILISGTGSICYGIDSNGRIKRAGGWGHIIDDEGSAYDIAIKGLKSVIKAFDGRGQKTLLKEKILKYLHLYSVEELIQFIYSKETTKDHIAKIAPIVMQSSVEGDNVSKHIMNEAIQSLIDMVIVVINDLDFNGERVELALTGGVFNNSEIIKQQFIDKITAQLQNLNLHRPLFDGAVGSMLIGWSSLNINYDIKRLKENLKEVVDYEQRSINENKAGVQDF
ncbi:N-acetylglucosamine kinase [Caloranaerobacter azorensis]|uniref:N-acetylglucosamine kinase n=1 Tax=Caloranaerobacter azorensis TaxID=116090 RepID=UPI00068F0F8E|nr:BadF/BadG/BcrA/BcrD ATPase family protein [Caloranaerobacter azorensis]